MTKFEMIERIRQINPTALPEFLDRFAEPDLLAYLRQLQELQREKLSRPAPEPLLVGQALAV